MRLRRKPAPTPTLDATARNGAWAGIAVTGDAPVVVIHARRASELTEAQQVA